MIYNISFFQWCPYTEEKCVIGVIHENIRLVPSQSLRRVRGYWMKLIFLSKRKLWTVKQLLAVKKFLREMKFHLQYTRLIALKQGKEIQHFCIQLWYIKVKNLWTHLHHQYDLSFLIEGGWILYWVVEESISRIAGWIYGSYNEVSHQNIDPEY